MSDQSKKRNDEAKDNKEPNKEPWERPEKTARSGQRLEQSKKKSAAPPTPEQARKKREKRIMIAMIALAVVMVLAASVALLIRRWFKKPDLPPGPSQTGSVTESGAPVTDPSAEPTLDFDAVQPLAGGERKSEDFYTVLIFGTDEVSGLTDTIMVASYDVTNQKATVLSIPRDTLINNAYLDKANKSINATYKQNGKGEKGAAALKTEVSRLVGFVPDYYVTINWDLVGKMVDAIDGVYFDVPWHMGYDDPTQDLHIHFEEGYQYLDGKAAMDLVRWRKNNDGKPGGGDGSDLSRLNVQHDFLKAVLKQTLQPQNIVRIPELIRLFNENVVSDLLVENMLWFGQQAVLGGLSVDDVSFVTMPVYGTANSGGRYYGKVCPIRGQLLTMINDYLNPFAQDVTLRQLDLIQMSIDGNTLSSTTGTLRNPAAGIYTPPESASPDPEESDDPMESDPLESGEPWESDPVTTDPAGGGPGPGQTDSPPPESEPPVEPPAVETSLPGGDGPDDGDWGDTPD